MAIPRNRMIPIVAIGVSIITVFVLMKSVSGSNDAAKARYEPMTAVPNVPTDGDTTADTLRTLTATVAGLNKTVEDVKSQNERLRNEKKGLEEKVGERIRVAIENERKLRAADRNDPEWSGLSSKVDQLAKKLDATIDSAMPTKLSANGGMPPTKSIGADIPAGLGYDGLDIKSFSDRHDIDISKFSNANSETLTWIKPLDVLYDKEGRPLPSLEMRSVNGAGNVVAKNGKPAKSNVRPVYTIPENATLVGSKSFTALIGRIPVDGKVHDPWPFKVLIGKTNLASNGIVIPGVEAMVATGSAVGDWTLSCVRGEIHSITFTFEDGTLVTQNAKSDQKGLAWISDEQGVPCVTGERITNAPSYLAGRTGLLALETAADAYATAQTTTTESETGAMRSSVTGNVDKFVIGKSIKGGVAESADWLRERQQQSFDVIFVKPGAEVELHLNVAVPIDYDSQGRKVSYAPTSNNQFRAALD